MIDMLGNMTEEMKAKSSATRKNSKEMLAKHGYPMTRSKAIRQHCLECSPESSSWVKNCIVTNCPLWPFRMGRSPRPEDFLVAQFSSEGDLVGYKHLDDIDAPVE